MLKDEPEDLTHLAPTAGDVCVPLDTCGLGHLGFVMSDVLDDLILTDCSLAPFDSLPAAAATSLHHHHHHHHHHHDPYSSSSGGSSSPVMQHACGGGSSDDHMSQHTADLCDPTMSTLLGMDLDNDGHADDLDLDLSLKNQFIPMYEDDLYPLLSGDLLWAGDRSPSPKSTTALNNNSNSW